MQPVHNTSLAEGEFTGRLFVRMQWVACANTERIDARFAAYLPNTPGQYSFENFRTAPGGWTQLARARFLGGNDFLAGAQLVDRNRAYQKDWYYQLPISIAEPLPAQTTLFGYLNSDTFHQGRLQGEQFFWRFNWLNFAQTECADSIDNDGDGKVGCSGTPPDPGCFPNNDASGASGACNPDDPDENEPPVASIAPVAAVFLGQTATIDGAGSFDPEGGPLVYAWAVQDSAGQLVPVGASAQETLVATDAVGYNVTLTVTDANGATGTESVSFAPFNNSPVATIATSADGVVIHLDGSASSDPDAPLDDIISHAWTVTGGNVTVDGADRPNAAFTAEVDVVYTVTLVVTDSHGATNTATGTVSLANEGGFFPGGIQEVE